MDKPTQEQIKEFWEWCGFRVKGSGFIWSDGRFDKAPPIDLNNLFKYAVPKLQDGTFVSIDFTPPFNDKESWLASLGYSRMAFESITEEADNPALALFWALWQVIIGGK